MKREKQVIQQLKQDAKKIEIPESIKPETMRRKLEHMAEWRETEGKNPGNVAKRKSKPWISTHTVRHLATAACVMLVLFGTAAVGIFGGKAPVDVDVPGMEGAHQQEAAPKQEAFPEKDEKNPDAVTDEEEIPYPQVTYADIYAAMLPTWEEQGRLYSAKERADGVMEYAEAETAANEMFSMATMDVAEEALVGTTNVQTAGVDEGDLVKNDGRYLYQSIHVSTEDGSQTAIQIVDTKDGLKEVARVGGFDSIQEFYVSEGLLIVIETKYRQDHFRTLGAKGGMYLCCEVLGYENYYHEITIFDLSNHVIPQKLKTFTLEGRYESSRIADGYFYGFSRFYAAPGDGAEDYDAYVPRIDGKHLAVQDILLPEDKKGTSYLVLISVDLKNPTELFRTTAIVSEGSLYYVSGKNIYVTYPQSIEGEDGWVSDTTAVLRFGYGAGRFALQAEGEVKGTLDDRFSLDEHNGYLRVVSTVREYQLRKLVDDRTGKVIGSSLEDERKTNALYVLNESLAVVGQIEGLAEEEQIYSARFLGEVGYFVTFRQTDPLFAVDLKDPANPRVLSELKISGFSEYLHFYGEDRLLGIGMEADEETGAQKGMKLSMFDISDPENVTEIQKLWLKDYDYSTALYNHRAVLISTQANLFGFEAEGSGKGNYWKDYLVFSYEDDAFVTRLKLDTKTDEGYYQSRGTFIGETFYLLTQDGSVTSYHLESGEKLESLKFE